MSTSKLKTINDFPERLKTLRGSRKQAEFARFIGVSAPLYNQWEKGQIPTSDKALLISKACNVPVDWLLTGRKGVRATLSYGFREKLFEAKGATGLDVLSMAYRMGVDVEDLERIMNDGGNPTQAMVSAFERHFQPVLDAKHSEGWCLMEDTVSYSPKLSCPSCESLREQLDRANAVIDKLTGRNRK